jgi:lipoprotein-anchoring transpeptidase ErfK/SrfK
VKVVKSAFLAIFFVLALGQAANADLLISIDAWKQRMTVFVDGQPRFMWLVSTGRAGYTTPPGSFRPFRLEAEHFSKEWDDAPMPHSIFFTEAGHAIHGTTHKSALGKPASHGCVRLAPENAAYLFALVEEHGLKKTRVEIDGPPREEVDTYEAVDAGSQRALDGFARWLRTFGGG